MKTLVKIFDKSQEEEASTYLQKVQEILSKSKYEIEFKAFLDNTYQYGLAISIKFDNVKKFKSFTATQKKDMFNNALFVFLINEMIRREEDLNSNEKI